MSENMIKTVFSILGTLMVSIILFLTIFTASGQQFLWRAIEPAMVRTWRESTMDNGAERTAIYEDSFVQMQSFQYSRNVNTH